MSRLILLVFLGLSISGASCNNDPCDRADSSLSNSFHPTGGQTLAASADRQFVVSTNVHENSLTLLRGTDLAKLDRIEIGSEPERIAPLGNGFVVSLRGERALARVSVVGGRLSVTERVDTGAEPVGLVTDEASKRVFVAASQSGLVEERDGTTLEVIRTFKVDHEPRWLALHPSGKTLYVATAMGGHLVIVDLVGGTTKEHQLPTINTFAETDDFRERARSKRITGDIAVRPDGTELLVPVLYVDNINPIDGDAEGSEESGDSYGNSSSGKRFIGTVTTVTVDKTGKPTGENRVQELEVPGDNFRHMHGGYVSSITVHPNEDIGFATMEASNTLVAFDLSPTETACTFGSPGDNNGHDGFAPMPGESRRGMSEPHRDGGFVPMANLRGFETNRGPTGVAFTSAGHVLVHSRLDRVVQRLDSGQLKPHVDGDKVWFDGRADREQNLDEPALDPAIAAGMNLFFSNTDQKMSGHNVNVSCSTCHFDGRNDGLTWTFADGPRQTPSLAGDVSETEPVTWRDDVATVADEVRLTSQGRMGGEGLVGAEAQTVADYVNWRRHLDLPNHGVDNVIIAEGKEIFESEAAGCSGCHSGDQYTDSSLHRVRGQNVRTPTLRGVAATAPYFHDGSSASLGELLERSRDGSMGNTGHLSDAQMAALEAYLTSL